MSAIWVLGPGLVSSSYGQAAMGRWDEIVGKKIVNREGEVLGEVTNAVIDIENARYVGMEVKSGGVLGLGTKTLLVPAGVVRESAPRQLFLDMDKATFRKAPSFKISNRNDTTVRLAKVYRYFGQEPYTSARLRIDKQEKALSSAQAGYLRYSSEILEMDVENTRGEFVGGVVGLRTMNGATGTYRGVVVSPSGWAGDLGTKVISPDTLSYNEDHSRLVFHDSARVFQENPSFVGVDGSNPVRDGSAFIVAAPTEQSAVVTRPRVQPETGRSAQVASGTRKVEDEEIVWYSGM